jgi:hypothetical protein
VDQVSRSPRPNTRGLPHGPGGDAGGRGGRGGGGGLGFGFGGSAAAVLRRGRRLLCDKLGLQRSPLPEIFIGLVGAPIIGVPRTVLRCLGLSVGPG